MSGMYSIPDSQLYILDRQSRQRATRLERVTLRYEERDGEKVSKSLLRREDKES